MAVVLGSTLMCLGATPVAAANNTVFTAYLGDCLFSGENAGASKTVKIEWRDSDGALKSKHSVTSNSAGKFTTLCELGELIETGDVLKTTIGTSARTFTIPRITAVACRALDCGHYVFGSSSPQPNTIVVVAVKWNGGFTSDYATTHTSVAQLNGSDFEAVTWDENPLLEGWDNVFVDWFNARGDVAIRQIQVAGIRLWLRQPFMEMVGNMRTEFAVELQRPTGNWIADFSGRLPYGGYATTLFQNNADNELIRLKSGDHVIVTMPYSRDYDLPTMSATISTSTDKVTVTSSCNLMGPGIAYVVVHNRSLSKSQYRTGNFSPGGQFVANFATSPAYNIAAGDKVDVYCRAMYGDVFAKTFTAG